MTSRLHDLTAARARLLRYAVAVVTLVFVSTGCGSSTADDRPSVVATTTQIGDWARAVGGAGVTVQQILRPNTDPHEYEPRPGDVQAMAGATVAFESGDNLDNWMEKVISASGGEPTVVVLGDRVPVRVAGESSGPEASRFDPHWWHDPRNAISAVAQIRDALAQADPAHAASYERAAAAYITRLRALDREITACIAAVPTGERKLVTDHDAFNYFAARYRIRVVGAVIPAQTTQAEPSAGQTAKLIALIRREHVKAVFAESSLNRKLAETVARETGARSDLTLYGDTLGPEGSLGATYIGMERANADAMVRGFTGGKRGCR